jgi:hypothetical protein
MSTPRAHDFLATEARQRRPAALLALLAALLYFFGKLVTGLVDSKDPSVGVLQGLAPAFKGLRTAAQDPRTGEEAFLSHHAFGFIASSLAASLGIIAMIGPLLYLHRAEQARTERRSRITGYLAIYAPLVLGIASFAYLVSLIIGAHNYITHSSRTLEAAAAATGGGVRVTLILLLNLGGLAITAAFILVSLHAMRVGLLTRLFGVLGIVAGILFLIVLTPLPVVQSVWLIGIAGMLLEFARRPLPPAWSSGEARPWPSQQRPARSAAPRGRWGRPVALPVDASPSPPAPRPPASAGSRKRKRRNR